MIATAAAILPADKFVRVVTALVRQFAGAMGVAVDAEWGFAIGAGYDIVAWVPRADHLALSLCPVEDDDSTGAAVRMVTVCPGTYRAYEVIGAAGVVVGEAHGLDAAMCLALDYVTLPMRAPAQHDHDPCAV